MRWLAVTGDLAFNLLFILLFIFEPAIPTPFSSEPALPRVDVVVSERGAWVLDDNGTRSNIAESDSIEGAIAVLHVPGDYLGLVTDLRAIKAVLARKGARAFQYASSTANEAVRYKRRGRSKAEHGDV